MHLSATRLVRGFSPKDEKSLTISLLVWSVDKRFETQRNASMVGTQKDFKQDELAKLSKGTPMFFEIVSHR